MIRRRQLRARARSARIRRRLSTRAAAALTTRRTSNAASRASGTKTTTTDFPRSVMEAAEPRAPPLFSCTLSVPGSAPRGLDKDVWPRCTMPKVERRTASEPQSGPGPESGLRHLLRESENFDEALAAHLAALAGRASRYENAMRGQAAEVRVEPCRDGEGRIVGALGVALDVTERKRIEDALRKSERLRLDAEALGHVGTWEHDFMSGEVYSSEENLRLLLGGDGTGCRSFDDYVAAIHPDDRERVLRQHDQLLAGSGLATIEYRVVWPDGSVHWIYGHKQIVRDASGKPLRQFGTNRDISERKGAEDELDRRVGQQAVVADLGLRALRGDGLQVLFDEAVACVAAVFDVELGMVMEALPDGGTLKMRAGAGPWREGAVGNATVTAANGFMGFYAMRAREPVVVADLASETRFLPCPLLLEHGIVSGVSVPIQGREAAYGILGAHSR